MGLLPKTLYVLFVKVIDMSTIKPHHKRIHFSYRRQNVVDTTQMVAPQTLFLLRDIRRGLYEEVLLLRCGVVLLFIQPRQER